MSINSNGPAQFQPLYLQVKARLIKSIVDGYWLPGDSLPSENQLASELGVSQGTVRKALDEMTSEKIVTRKQGRGTYVSEHTQEQSLFHFFRFIDSDGNIPTPTSKVLKITKRKVTQTETQKLQIESDSKVCEILRVRSLEGVPSILERIILPISKFPDIASETSLPNTLYTYYQKRYGLSVHKATESINAVIAGKMEIKELSVEPGQALLQIDRVAYSIDNKPIELRISRCTSDSYKYNVELT